MAAQTSTVMALDIINAGKGPNAGDTEFVGEPAVLASPRPGDLFDPDVRAATSSQVDTSKLESAALAHNLDFGKTRALGANAPEYGFKIREDGVVLKKNEEGEWCVDGDPEHFVKRSSRSFWDSVL